MSSLYDEIAVRIRPFDGRITVEERTGDAVAVKNISKDSLVECFAKSIRNEATVSSGFLPDNCISFTVSDNNKTVALCIPPHYGDITYFKTVYERFPLPAMAFSFSIGPGGRVWGSRLTIIKDEKPTPKTPLYLWPFSNVYDDSGICVGAANSLPVYKELRTLATLPYHILRFPNNDHMFKKAYNKMKLPYRDLLEHLKDKEPSYYYERVLVPRKAALRDFIEDKLGG